MGYRAAFSVAALLGAALFWSATDVFPHDAPSGWTYPLQCCANYDCRQTLPSEIKEAPDGYHVPSGEVIPMSDKRIKESPDGEFHWCAHQYGDHKTICLFVPPRSY